MLAVKPHIRKKGFGQKICQVKKERKKMKVFRKNGYYPPSCIEPQPPSRLLDTVLPRVEMRAARESVLPPKHISVLSSSIPPAAQRRFAALGGPDGDITFRGEN